MANINFVENFENTSHFNEDALFLIVTFITNDAEALGAVGVPDNLYITCCDIDRIYLSTKPEASPDSPPDYVIRMRDYHICEEDRSMVHMNSTFHIMKDCSDGSGRCSAEQFYGDYDILVNGAIAKLRVAVLKGLSAIQIPDYVTVIPKEAFSRCPNLKEVHIPEGVTTIEPFAFADCIGLREVYIPNSVLSIGTDAFEGCDNLTEISVPFVLNITSAGLEESTNVVIRSNDSWFESICETYGLTGSDDPDEEIRTLTILKNNWVSDGEDEDVDDLLGESIKRYVSIRYRKEWYKNYIGTKKITFDGPTNYEETGEITDEDISAFISDHYMVDFANYRLKAGHTERQDKFIQLMRDCPIELLDWLDDAIPYGFFKRIAQGGEYELFGYSKDRFLHECGGDDSEMPFEYVSTLEEKYGIDYAVDYLFELDWPYWYVDQDSDEPNSNQLSDPAFIYFINLFTKAIDNNNNEKALRILSFFYYHHTDHCLSIKLMSRLSTLWKKGLISDDWITDDMHGLVGIIDLEWGILDDINWEEDLYPEHPDDDNVRLWLMKLLESDFAADIAYYLKPLLEQVLERERNHNWESGKKAIESFLAKTSNK